MNDLQYLRLEDATKLRKYGLLETWEELYYFQRSIADFRQIKEIGEYARKNNNGENIILPLIKKISPTKSKGRSG